MDESRALDEDQDTDRCPVPAWALRPLAVLLPLLVILCIVWIVLR